MAGETYDLTSTWSETARYTSSGETAVLVSNLSIASRGVIGWAVTSSDTTPDIGPTRANPILPGYSQALTLGDGERLWLAMMFGEIRGLGRVQE